MPKELSNHRGETVSVPDMGNMSVTLTAFEAYGTSRIGAHLSLECSGNLCAIEGHRKVVDRIRAASPSVSGLLMVRSEKVMYPQGCPNYRGRIEHNETQCPYRNGDQFETYIEFQIMDDSNKLED